MFKDIRADYGSTSTILTEHLRAVDVNISERTATAMLYAIKSDTLFFARHTNRVDLEAFTFLYPLADAALIRKMEGAEITLERLELRHAREPGRDHARPGVQRLHRPGAARGLHSVHGRFLPAARRREVDDHRRASSAPRSIVSVRNLGYSRNAGEFVKRWFADIGSAGGHRAMAKAVVPMDRFRAKFGDIEGPAITARIAEMAEQFLHETAPDKKKEPVAR